MTSLIRAHLLSSCPFLYTFPIPSSPIHIIHLDHLPNPFFLPSHRPNTHATILPRYRSALADAPRRRAGRSICRDGLGSTSTRTTPALQYRSGPTLASRRQYRSIPRRHHMGTSTGTDTDTHCDSGSHASSTFRAPLAEPRRGCVRARRIHEHRIWVWARTHLCARGVAESRAGVQSRWVDEPRRPPRPWAGQRVDDGGRARRRAAFAAERQHVRVRRALTLVRARADAPGGWADEPRGRGVLCARVHGGRDADVHCERVRKMPLSRLDPSMLIGFVVRMRRSGRI
ncbi:hypothetical protein B0H14DRAFT_1314066 [Mycena olivaceomarginata]|nr:hypothetical protein B0H14DRAFT_1314066 [Mycena olivaceomarginata]